MLKSVGAFEPVPKEDLTERIANLRRSMEKASIDFALIVQNVDRFYFSGTMQKGVLAIPLDREPILFLDKGMERAGMETDFPIVPVKSQKEMGRILRDRGIVKGTAGLELDVLPVSYFEKLRSAVGFDRFADITPAIRELRAVKRPFELAQIRKSGTILSHVFRAARDVVREGVTEIDIEAALFAEGRRLGHPGYLRMRGVNQEIMIMVVQSGGYTGTITTFVDGAVAGPGITPAVPQGSSLKKVERGIPVTIDYCGAYNGYNTDETRAFVVGEMKEIFKKPYETAKAIIEDFQAYGREGVDCTDLFHRAYSLVKKAGLEDYFMGHGDGQVPFIGHGVGLEINELPVITGSHTRLLQEGMVFALEPKFVLPPHGAVGVEVDFIVTQDGLERLTSDSLDIVEL